MQEQLRSGRTWSRNLSLQQYNVPELTLEVNTTAVFLQFRTPNYEVLYHLHWLHGLSVSQQIPRNTCVETPVTLNSTDIQMNTTQMWLTPQGVTAPSTHSPGLKSRWLIRPATASLKHQDSVASQCCTWLHKLTHQKQTLQKCQVEKKKTSSLTILRSFN